MSRDFPDLIDPWQLVAAGRGFSGSWPVAKMSRLAEVVETAEDDVKFSVQFGVDDLGVSFASLDIETELTLLCQRSLEPFRFPVARSVRLGLIANEEDEAALPDGYEPYLVPAEPVRLVDIVEDELLLAVPLVPKSAGEHVEWSSGDDELADDEQAEKPNPFAALADLKKQDLS